LLWYDCILTFPEEYRRMWKRKFTGGTAVYFLVRYTALLERVPFLLEAFVWHSSDQVPARMVSMATSIILIVSAWIKTFGIVGNPFKSSSQTPLATLLLRDGEPLA
ncbi:hypothetical protein C8Q77DRAFT_1065260, partial [Trametes polyzona]